MEVPKADDCGLTVTNPDDSTKSFDDLSSESSEERGVGLHTWNHILTSMGLHGVVLSPMVLSVFEPSVFLSVS